MAPSRSQLRDKLAIVFHIDRTSNSNVFTHAMFMGRDELPTNPIDARSFLRPTIIKHDNRLQAELTGTYIHTIPTYALPKIISLSPPRKSPQLPMAIDVYSVGVRTLQRGVPALVNVTRCCARELFLTVHRLGDRAVGDDGFATGAGVVLDFDDEHCFAFLLGPPLLFVPTDDRCREDGFVCNHGYLCFDFQADEVIRVALALHTRTPTKPTDKPRPEFQQVAKHYTGSDRPKDQQL